MRADLSYIYDSVAIPDDAKLGDRFTLTAEAILTQQTVELINVSSHTKDDHLPGETKSILSLGNITVTPA